jgi:hypothetical protein
MDTQNGELQLPKFFDGGLIWNWSDAKNDAHSDMVKPSNVSRGFTMLQNCSAVGLSLCHAPSLNALD